LIPALIGVVWLGDSSVGQMLVLSQVVLSLQLPFALWPLIRFTSDKGLMGPFVNSRLVQIVAWGLFGLISAANLTLLWFWIS
jgi:manganese transport protein